jgi:hypothetical protein
MSLLDSLRRLIILWWHGMTEADAQRIASKEWLLSREWDAIRYQAYEANDGRCECCGRSRHDLPHGEYLNADHIRCRRDYPWLALKLSNIQILCGRPCNRGKGNGSKRDWRHPDHPHRNK